MSGYIPYMDDGQGRGASEPIREDNREYPRSYSGTHSREGRYGYDQDKHVQRMSSRFNKEFKKRRHYDKKHEEYTSDTPHDCIRVEMCEFYPWENAQEHNTHMYEIVYNEPNRPVYRRGLTFKMTIWFKERPFEPERDNVRLVFNFGPNPSVPKETKIFLPLTSQEYRYDDDRVHNWEANIVRMNDRCMDVEVYIPPDAPVGVWRCWVETCPEGFSYYYRDGSQYHPSSYRRSRRDCSPWRSGPCAFRGEQGSPDRWDWAPFYRDYSMYNFNNHYNRRGGSWNRCGSRNGSWDRYGFRDDNCDRYGYRDGSRDKYGYRDSSRDRYGYREGSWDRWGHRDGSRYSWDWAPFNRSNSRYCRNSSPYRRGRGGNSYDNSSDRYGCRNGSWDKWGRRDGSFNRWGRRDSSWNRWDCRDGSGNRWDCRDGSYDSWDWAPFYKDSSASYRDNDNYRGRYRNNSSYERYSSPFGKNHRSNRNGSWDRWGSRNGSLNRYNLQGESWDQWGRRDGSWDRRNYRDGNRDSWDWAPFYRDSSPCYGDNDCNRKGYRNNNSYGRYSSPFGQNRRFYRNSSWDTYGSCNGSWNKYNRRGGSWDQWRRRDGSWDRRNYRDGSRDSWDWAPFYRDSSPSNRDNDYYRGGYRNNSSYGRYSSPFGQNRRSYHNGTFDWLGSRHGSWNRYNRRGRSLDQWERRDGSWNRRNYRDGSRDSWDWAPFNRDSSPYYGDNGNYRGRYGNNGSYGRNSSPFSQNRRYYRNGSWNSWGSRSGSWNRYNRRNGSWDQWGRRVGSFDRWSRRGGSLDRWNRRDSSCNRWNRRSDSWDQWGRRDGSWDRWNRRDGSWNRWNRRGSSFDRKGYRDGSYNRSYYRDGSGDRWDWAPFYRDSSPCYRDNEYYRGNRSWYRDDSWDNYDRQDGSYDSYYRRGGNWNKRRDSSPYRWDWAPYHRYRNRNSDNNSYYGDRNGYWGDNYYRNRYYNRYDRDDYFGDNFYRHDNSWDDDWCGRDDDYWRYRRDGYWYDRSSYCNEYPYDFNGEVFKCKQDVYILFNPWCRDDPTYMDDEMWRQEYVLNDTGKIWVGSYMQNRGRRWVYGQFDDVVLPAVMYLLEEARMSGSDRANPIRVVRAISEMVNNQDWNQKYNNRRRNDQQGNCLMMGRWDGKYDDGVSPYNWTGSVRIMEQYLRTGKPVKYGQCWVYAGVATTICRALGIPCRPVTNFTSAHDTNNTMSVDKYFSVNGDEIERGPDGDSFDSIWSFHCWNEVWMDRPDLPSGYGGWQAIDCTYQEESDGGSKCGPASLECIRSGEIGFNYDTKYLFTEINAEINHWQQDEYADHGFNRMRPGRYCVGREILTKRPDYDDDEYDDDCMDVIYEYKPRDWHYDHDRIMNAFRGMEHGYRTKKYDRYFSDQEDVLFEMEAMPMVYMGQPFMVQMHMMNRSKEPRSIEAMMSCHSMYYNGVKNRRIQQNKEYFVLPPNQEETFMLRVMPEDYEEQMVDFCMMKIYCIANVKETRQAWGEEEDFYFQKPRIHIQTSGPQQVDQDFEVNFGFTNPLDIPLTNCRFSFEGPGLQRPRTVKYRDVRPGEMVNHIERFVPKQPGETKIVATFTSHQLNDVFGSRTIGIRE